MQVLKTKSFEDFVIKDFKSRDFETLLAFKYKALPLFLIYLFELNKLVLKMTRNHFSF